ncbi:competence type IV pilus minor pilin ComGE [Streptococcus iniae]|uniref:competence type IV pilus minor pilin ComGE n=1 Tax=Streptococcus iniae TaxID=1346 RepID=UPI00217F0959|nr:competence type IV pilus minor pilin ComGE [Streptococcus iniae]
MEHIEKRVVRAYLLLEGVIALAIMVMIVSLILTGIRLNQQFLAKSRHQEELIVTALMAVQTNRRHLKINGCEVDVVRSEKGIEVSEKHQKVFSLKKN